MPKRGREMPKHCKNQAFCAVGASSCSCQKERHEVGRKCPNSAKSKDSGVVGRPGPSPTYGVLPDLAWDPFPGPSLNPGNLQTRPTGPNRIVWSEKWVPCVAQTSRKAP